MAYPNISIITPVLNAEAYIERCINNVNMQGIKSLEHIVVDGGSSDNTISIVEELAKTHSHVKIIYGPDKGQSDAMNKGIRSATSSIIGILNVDDTYEIGTLKKAIDILNKISDPTLVVANCKIVDGKGALLSWNKPRDLRLRRLLLGGDVAQFPANPCAYFYHKSVHEVVGYYNVNEHYAMDVDFIFACSAYVNVIYQNEFWGTFYNLPGTKTVLDSPNSRMRIRKLKAKYFKKLNILDKGYVISHLAANHMKRILSI